MAKFDIPGNYDKVSNAYFNDAWDHLSTHITYSKNNNEIFVYSNYPEYLENSHRGDASTPHYINKVDVSGKTKMLIYATHHLEYLSGSYYFAIRVFNPSSTKSVQFTKAREGFSNSNSWFNPGYAWEDFNNKYDSLTLGPNETNWLVTKAVPTTGNSSGSFLDYFGEFEVNNPFTIAIYICKNINNVPGITYELDWDNHNTYSGFANNYSLNCTKTLDMADALVSYEKSFFFGISNPYEGLGGNSEKVTFYPNQSAYGAVNENIGNYGLQYNFRFTFKNTSNKPVKVKCYIISNTRSHFAGIASLNRASKFLSSENSSDPNRWNFHTTNTIAPSGNSVTIDFTYCHLALGSRGAILQFEAVEA